ncbi:fused MFS/spermidine synthase [Thalassobaculum sp.]|uniref:fused MFS/spermidine synthase n=1 Tax=Thalassobaculum sp. TaxID=2022740 RepID=UPI0032EFDC43
MTAAATSRPVLLRRIVLDLTLLLSAACGLIVEIVAGRLIAPYVGMSLYTWTAIIAVVLAGLSAGHWIGGQLATAKASEATTVRRLSLALVFASVSSLASLGLLRIISGPLLSSGIGDVPAVMLLCAALFLLPSLFVGIVAPIVTRLAVEQRADDPGPVIGRMYALGTLGSIAGTLSAGYLFISWIGSAGTIVAVSATYAGLAVLCALYGRQRTIALVIGIAIVLLGSTATWTGRQGAFASACLQESDYFCIRVDDFSAVSGRPSALIVLDHLAHSINDRDDPSILFSAYVHFVDEYTRRRHLERRSRPTFSAFFIGGGGYTLPRAWAESVPNARLVVAEIDPAVTRMARDHLWFDAAHPAIAIHHRDARLLLQSLPAEPTFDVVFGDAFHDISIPSHLVTREFHDEIARRLTPNGFYVANVVDSGVRPRFLSALIHTLQQDYRSVEVWAEAEAVVAAVERTGERTTYIVVAGRSPGPYTRLDSRNGLQRQWLRLPLKAVQDLAGTDVPILTDDFAPVDRLMASNPIASRK